MYAPPGNGFSYGSPWRPRYGPPVPAPAGSGCGPVLVFLGVIGGLFLVALVVIALILGQLGGDPTPPPPSPTRSTRTTRPPSTQRPSEPPSTAPTNTNRLPKGRDILTKNPVYRQVILKTDGACKRQVANSSRKKWEAQVRAIVRCQEVIWSRVINRTGYRFTRVKIVFFNRRITSACGEPSRGWVAFYCSGDRTMYFSTTSYEQATYYRLSTAETVIHEYVHHVQAMTGILDQAYSLDESQQQISRRIELQDLCMTHYGLARMKGIDVTSGDVAELKYQWGYSSLPKTHGSVKAKRYWGPRGLYGKTLGACNTFAASRSKVG